MASPPSLAQAGLNGPLFLRKLPRKNSWGDPATPIDQRVADVVQAVFLQDPKPYSLFQVASDEDLRRVTMGINGGRGSLREDVHYIPILPTDLSAVRIDPSLSTGDTRCHLANRLHFDIAAEPDQLRDLCRTLLHEERKVLSMKRNQLEPWAEQTRSEGCLADRESAECKVSGCVPIENSTRM